MIIMEQNAYIVGNDSAGERVDILAATLSGLTRSHVHNLITQGLLTVNGHAVKPNFRPKRGDVITLTMPEEEQDLDPEDLPVEILFRDEFLMVVNKPPAMVVYPAAGHARGTLMNAVAYHADRLAHVGGPLRPGVVHRLDKDTSGVMVIALDDTVYYDLVNQFSERTIARRYRAIVFGRLKGETGEIDLSIGRSQSDRKKMSTRSHRGKEAVTTWRVIERFQAATLIEAKLLTGRTHQIRVHFSSIGHPVLGDRTYGGKTYIDCNRRRIVFPRQMLHAELLGFVHPASGQYLEFTSPMPDDMMAKLLELRA